jgi:hypothetical protein
MLDAIAAKIARIGEPMGTIFLMVEIMPHSIRHERLQLINSMTTFLIDLKLMTQFNQCIN